jgi:predicted acyltransferase
MKWLWTALAVLLVDYWLLWALLSGGAGDFDWGDGGRFSRVERAAQLSPGLPRTGTRISTFGNRFDQWFLNLFPARKPIRIQLRGLPDAESSFRHRHDDPGADRRRLDPRVAAQISTEAILAGGAGGIALGLALHYSHVCPVVKRIWTPSWTIFSGGICFLFLAAFAWLIEVKGYRKWAFPLVVVGMNSIAAYCMAHFLEGFLASSLRIHLGANFFTFFGQGLEPFFQGAAILLLYWLILLEMYRQKLFLRI